MEWYLELGVIIAFLGSAVMLVWLGATGRFEKRNFDVLCYITSTIDSVIDHIRGTAETQELKMFSTISEIVKQAVYAAENAWYNSEITKEERYKNCIKNIDAMLVATGIELTMAQHEIVDVLIKAACEELGHWSEVTATDEIVMEQ